MVFNLHAPQSMESFCMIARYGWCLQGVVDVLTLNNYRFLLFYCSYFKPQSCQVIKKEKSEKPVSRREHASKEALFFLLFLIHPVVHHHTLSLLFYFPFFLFHFPFISQWGVSLLCPPVWAGVESGCVSPQLAHYVWARQIRRSAAGRSEMLSYLHLPRYSSGIIISQARTRSRTKAIYPAAILMSAHLQQWRPSCFNSEQNKMIIWKWHANRFLKISQSSAFLSDSSQHNFQLQGYN